MEVLAPTGVGAGPDATPLWVGPATLSLSRLAELRRVGRFRDDGVMGFRMRTADAGSFWWSGQVWKVEPAHQG